MKKLFISFLLLFTLTITAQTKDCEYSFVQNDSIQIRSTKESLMFEKVFGGTSTFIFFYLTDNDGLPILNFQLLAKSNDFPKMYCLDKASKIYLQLTNGKIVTLISANSEDCSKTIYESNEKKNISILTGSFLFTKGGMEDLEKYPISLMRIKYVGEMVDYPVPYEINSETMKQKYSPESYFINNLKCIK